MCHYRRATSATAGINVGYLHDIDPPPPSPQTAGITGYEGMEAQEKKRGSPLGKIEDDVIVVREHGSRGFVRQDCVFGRALRPNGWLDWT